MPTGVYQRKPLSAETKAKIGAANRGKVRTPEQREVCRAARLGKKFGPYSPEHCAAISAAKKGRPQTEAHRLANSESHKGQVVSPAQRRAISIAHLGKKRPPFTEEWKAKIGDAGVGRIVSAETRAKRSASLKVAWGEGRHPVNKSYRYTSLAQALHAHLAAAGLTLEPEVRFGRFTVDLYDREHHVAYEADGKYWHDKNEAMRPGYQAERDAYLSARHGLRVVHYTDADIRELTKRRAS